MYPSTARDLAEARRRGVIGLPREGARLLREVIYEDTPIFLCATDLGIEGEEGYRLAVDVEVYRPTNVYPKITGAEMPPRTIDRAAFGGRFPAQVAVERVGFETRAARRLVAARRIRRENRVGCAISTVYDRSVCARCWRRRR